MSTTYCQECGAFLEQGKLCKEYLERMIAWDFEDFQGVGHIHHLTVLCYNLQHPHVYSSRGLEDAKDFLIEFVVKNASFEEHDKRNKERLSSNVRDWKISGTEDDHGSYSRKPTWRMTARDVVDSGLESYVGNVKKWSKCVYEDLKESSNLE
jgi:hypothetical protein